MSFPSIPYGFAVDIFGVNNEASSTSDIDVVVGSPPTGMEVAFTGASPTDPAGKLYLKVSLNADFSFGGYVDPTYYDNSYAQISTSSDDINSLLGAGAVTPALITPRLVFKLANSEPSCALYGITYINDNSFTPSYGSISGTNLVLEAKEWFPYAKNDPVVPVWNSDTGVKL